MGASRERSCYKFGRSFINTTAQYGDTGQIDDVPVYKRELTDEEANQLAGETLGNV